MADWMQAICAIVGVLLAFWGIKVSLPKISKDINKSASERLEKLENQLREHVRGYSDEAVLNMWKRLIDLYTNDSKIHEYSNLNENANKK